MYVEIKMGFVWYDVNMYDKLSYMVDDCYKAIILVFIPKNSFSKVQSLTLDLFEKRRQKVSPC